MKKSGSICSSSCCSVGFAYRANVFLTQDKHVLFELTLSLLAGVISGLHQLLELCRHGDGNLQEGQQKSVSKT